MSVHLVGSEVTSQVTQYSDYGGGASSEPSRQMGRSNKVDDPRVAEERKYLLNEDSPPEEKTKFDDLLKYLVLVLNGSSDPRSLGTFKPTFIFNWNSIESGVEGTS